MDESAEQSTRPGGLRRLHLGLALIAGCATTSGVAVEPTRVPPGDGTFLVSGMRHVVSLALPPASCTRLTVPLAGTLRDVDLTLLDDAGQVLASDLREEGPPIIEVCARVAQSVHALVRVQSGAGGVRVDVEHAPLRDAPRASRADDVTEAAFVDLDEPTRLRTLRAHAEVLARRGFTRTEPFEEDVIPEARPVELALAVPAGTCATVSVLAQRALSLSLSLSLVDEAGEEVAVGSRDGDVTAVQTCDEGASRVLVHADAGTRITFLVAYGRARDVGGPTGLWLGHRVAPVSAAAAASPAPP